MSGQADVAVEAADDRGLSRYRDPITERLGILASGFDQVHKARQGLTSIGLPASAEELLRIETQLGRELVRTLRRHPLWNPFLRRLPGVGGVHMARLISRIRDPLKFPGRRCSAGHYLPADFTGAVCPVILRRAGVGDELDRDDGPSEGVEAGADGQVEIEHRGGPCLNAVGSIRPGTGVRSLWHFTGMHVVDGHSARRVRHVKASWDPIARTCLMQPGGIAEQIVRLRVEPYRSDAYDQTRVRLEQRGVVEWSGIEKIRGTSQLPPWRIDRIARVVAAKSLLGDLLIAWKEVA